MWPFATALAYALEMIVLPRPSTATFSTLLSLDPTFGPFSGLPFFRPDAECLAVVGDRHDHGRIHRDDAIAEWFKPMNL